MAFKHTLKRGSTRPVLRYPLPGVDLTGATATFLMSPRPGQPATVNAPAVIANGALEYHWQHGDTDNAVMHYGEFEVVFPGGAIETFPADDYIRIEVKQDIGDGGAAAPPALITLTGALVEAGTDAVSGAGAVSIALSGALVETDSDTAVGAGTVATPAQPVINLTGALVETGADVASGTGTVATLAPSVTIPDDGGNKLGTTVSVTADGEVTITGSNSPLQGDLGLGHYLVRADNMAGKTLTVKRSTQAPFQNGDLLNLWQMAWAYDLDGEWFPFDSVTNTGGVITATNAAPLEQGTVFISRRAFFSNTRWNAAIARWKASAHTGPTASGNADFVIGTLPANAHAPAMPIYGFKFGTGAKAVTLTGNIHVDEGIGGYSYEALVDWLLSADPHAVALRGACTFYAYPKLNPQARHAGASRVEVETGMNANRIFLGDGSKDHINLSKMMRDAWAVDLPSKLNGTLDFHDNSFGSDAKRGHVYDYGAGDLIGYLKAQYFTRTGADVAVDPAPSDAPGTITSYLKATFSPDWAGTVEHGTSTADGWEDWKLWGIDVGIALRSYLVPADNAPWIKPTWLYNSSDTVTSTNGTITVVSPTTSNPVASFEIPQGKNVEVIFDLSFGNVSGTFIRQSDLSNLPAATSTTLFSRSVSGAPLRRVQSATWSAQKPYVGVICGRNNNSQPGTINLLPMTRYRVISDGSSDVTLSGALIDAGADTVSGTASVGITASAALAESGADTASGDMAVGPAPITAQRAIILTDYAGDCDDAAALLIACYAHKRGEVNILGVVATSSIATSAAGVYGQLAAYGMEDIPVYAYQGSLGTYNNRISAAVRDAFGEPGQTRTAFEDDLTGLRRMLAEAPDASVRIIDVGAPISTARLLDSPADAISPLTGMELAAAKVSGLWMMAGQFNTTTAEYNATRHIASTQRVYHDWPTPIYAHGWEVGGDVLTGPPPAGYGPVKVAFDSFAAFTPLNGGKRESWDPVTVHHAVYGNGSLYQLGGAGGTITVDSAGVTRWSATPAGNRSYVTKATTAANIAAAVQSVIDQSAALVVKAPNNTQSSWQFPITEGTGSQLTADTGALAGVFGPAWASAPTRLTFGGYGTIPMLSDDQDKDFLIGALVRFNSISGTQQIVTRDNLSRANSRFWHFRNNAGKLEYISFADDGTATTVTGSAGSIAAGSWALLTAHVTDAAVVLRANGQQVGAGSIPPRKRTIDKTQSLYIGARVMSDGRLASDTLKADLAALSLKLGATTAEIAAFEADLRAIATAKGITLP